MLPVPEIVRVSPSITPWTFGPKLQVVWADAIVAENNNMAEINVLVFICCVIYLIFSDLHAFLLELDNGLVGIKIEK